jgi:hypothetical protein
MVVAVEYEIHWEVLKVEFKNVARNICQTSRCPAECKMNITRVVNAEAASLIIINQRLSQRSTSDPKNGESKTEGRVNASKFIAKRVVEPVSRYIQTPRAKLVRPEPSVETSCPNHTTAKFRIFGGCDFAEFALISIPNKVT